MLSLNQQYSDKSISMKQDPNNVSIEVWQNKVNFVIEDHAPIWGRAKLRRGLLENSTWGEKSHWDALFYFLRRTIAKKYIYKKQRKIWESIAVSFPAVARSQAFNLCFEKFKWTILLRAVPYIMNNMSQIGQANIYFEISYHFTTVNSNGFSWRLFFFRLLFYITN